MTELNRMSTDEKLDYLIEMLEGVEQKVESLEEQCEELIEKVADLGTPFGQGYEFETQ